MPHLVAISAQALAEIDEAIGWIKKYSPVAAARWHLGVLTAIDSLEQFPERCGLAAEVDAFGFELRELLFGKRRGVYRILFRVDQLTVTILHVRHSARDRLPPD